MTTYGYVRVSTEDQSTDMQLDALRPYAPEHIASDDGISGLISAYKRPGLASLLPRLTRGDTLVVYSISRLGRTGGEVIMLLDELARKGVYIRSVTECIDTSTPMGEMFVGMLALFARMESRLISERTRAGMAAAKSRGRHVGRPRKVLGA